MTRILGIVLILTIASLYGTVTCNLKNMLTLENTSSTSLDCAVGGRYNELCIKDIGEPVDSDVEWRKEFNCFEFTECGILPSGICGWFETPEFKKCLSECISPPPIPSVPIVTTPSIPTDISRPPAEECPTPPVVSTTNIAECPTPPIPPIVTRPPSPPVIVPVTPPLNVITPPLPLPPQERVPVIPPPIVTRPPSPPVIVPVTPPLYVITPPLPLPPQERVPVIPPPIVTRPTSPLPPQERVPVIPPPIVTRPPSPSIIVSRPVQQQEVSITQLPPMIVTSSPIPTETVLTSVPNTVMLPSQKPIIVTKPMNPPSVSKYFPSSTVITKQDQEQNGSKFENSQGINTKQKGDNINVNYMGKTVEDYFSQQPVKQQPLPLFNQKIITNNELNKDEIRAINEKSTFKQRGKGSILQLIRQVRNRIPLSASSGIVSYYN